MDGVVEVESLVTELLAELEALGDREGSGKLRFVALVFTIDLGPLDLVPWSEQWACTGSHVPDVTPHHGGSVTGIAGGWRFSAGATL
jgi:hypothetical protein